MLEARKRRFEPRLVSSRVSHRAEKHGALIVVHTDYSKPFAMEMRDDLRANEAGRTGYENQWLCGRHEGD
jgi:hypothetical protein